MTNIAACRKISSYTKMLWLRLTQKQSETVLLKAHHTSQRQIPDKPAALDSPVLFNIMIHLQ